MESLFQVPAEISKVTTMSNRQLRITIDTQENLSDEMISRLFSLVEKLGWLTFNVQEIKPEDLLNLPDIKTEKGDKTPSQRLRARMFVYFKELKNPKGDGFDDWYKIALEKIGDEYLSKLND